MKTEEELSADIVNITETIRKTFPELAKNIGETPVKIAYKGGEDPNIKSLTDYYNSLEIMLKKFSDTHHANNINMKNLPKEVPDIEPIPKTNPNEPIPQTNPVKPEIPEIVPEKKIKPAPVLPEIKPVIKPEIEKK